MVMVTHDLADAVALADRVLVLNHGQLVETLNPQALDRARDPWVHRFVSAHLDGQP
jgi:ABC-type transporter Mla maintaining outer membrane lipid asymmetry ATPase subunit MlaF